MYIIDEIPQKIYRYRDSLVVQIVESLNAVWETWVQPLDWEDPLEKEINILD